MRRLFAALVAAFTLSLALPAMGATCSIGEFRAQQSDPGLSLLAMPVLDTALAIQKITYTTSTQTAALNASTVYIYMTCDAAAYIAIGANPTATATSLRVPANIVVYFSISTKSQKIAIYDGTS